MLQVATCRLPQTILAQFLRWSTGCIGMKFCKYCIHEEYPLSVMGLRGLLARSF
jgi:hypothetical protein